METSWKILRASLSVWFSIFIMGSCHSISGKNHKDKNNNKAVVDTVFIKDMKFLPEEIKVRQGDTIVWINKDLVDHCVTELKGKTWTSGLLASGSSWKMAAKQSSDYYCTIHQVMKGKIVME